MNVGHTYKKKREKKRDSLVSFDNCVGPVASCHQHIDSVCRHSTYATLFHDFCRREERRRRKDETPIKYANHCILKNHINIFYTFLPAICRTDVALRPGTCGQISAPPPTPFSLTKGFPKGIWGYWKVLLKM